MDYFKILNLNREPFSNSPEPDFFFPPPGQAAILQQLEIAIRLRRGLNVVMGEVGTGKSTLCRQLIIRLSASEADRQEIETSLILDPSFSTPREFLDVVSGGLGIARHGEQKSDWRIKDDIKNTLYQKGLVENKLVVMIIDEGQKIPFFTLEILREFLNFETNENKLLQIVIFAQNEFRETLAGMKNFADRVNRHHRLAPLNFSETRGMINFRLQKAASPARTPTFFTKPALLAIYLATGGFPRRIVTACHHILLAMIIKNQTSANLALVRANIALFSFPEKRKREPAKKKAAVVYFALAVVAMVFFLSAISDILHLILSAYRPERQTMEISAAMPPSAPEAFFDASAFTGTLQTGEHPVAAQKDKKFVKLRRTWFQNGY
jgi:general secretion pathway protein A